MLIYEYKLIGKNPKLIRRENIEVIAEELGLRRNKMAELVYYMYVENDIFYSIRDLEHISQHCCSSNATRYAPHKCPHCGKVHMTRANRYCHKCKKDYKHIRTDGDYIYA